MTHFELVPLMTGTLTVRVTKVTISYIWSSLKALMCRKQPLAVLIKKKILKLLTDELMGTSKNPDIIVVMLFLQLLADWLSGTSWSYL